MQFKGVLLLHVPCISSSSSMVTLSEAEVPVGFFPLVLFDLVVAVNCMTSIFSHWNTVNPHL